MEAVAATGPGCEAGKCSGPGSPGTGPDFGDFPESVSPAAVGSGPPEMVAAVLTGRSEMVTVLLELFQNIFRT